MIGSELAKRVIVDFATQDVEEIARSSGITIRSERWFPVTVGEFDPRAMTILVNESASVCRERIIAHELGHYFLRRYSVEAAGDAERICDDFADALTGEDAR